MSEKPVRAVFGVSMLLILAGALIGNLPWGWWDPIEVKQP